jgi:PPOX class probable F420-dependent enzyme
VKPLSDRELELLRAARRAVLATVAPDGTPRLVPITFAVDAAHGALVVYAPIDEKRKSVSDPRRLARVRDIASRPRVALLVDEFGEDWSSLGWLRVHGEASLIGPDAESALEHAAAVRLLRAKYEQYATHALESRPIIRIETRSTTSWFATP